MLGTSNLAIFVFSMRSYHFWHSSRYSQYNKNFLGKIWSRDSASILLFFALNLVLVSEVFQLSVFWCIHLFLQVRVVQGKETPVFLNLFKGGMIIHSGR